MKTAAATAATVSFSGVGALAAPVTIDFTLDRIEVSGIESTVLQADAGSGSVTLDDTPLVPISNNTSTFTIDAANVDAFSVQVNDPDFGALTFELADLDSIEIKLESIENGGDPLALAFVTDSGGIADFGNPDVDFGKVDLIGVPVGSIDPVANTYAVNLDVPEPSTLGLLALGAAGLPLLRRRRRKA
ncbi:MAG: PEP-CTERM sorting domain-containing protein [Alphaproteobacteria bacterium]